MEFSHGISPQSLERWEAFQQITKTRKKRRDKGIGTAVLERIIKQELDAIEKATEEYEMHHGASD